MAILILPDGTKLETKQCRRCEGKKIDKKTGEPCGLCFGSGMVTQKWSRRNAADDWKPVQLTPSEALRQCMDDVKTAADMDMADVAIVLYELTGDILAGVVRGKPVAVLCVTPGDLRGMGARHDLAPMKRAGAACYVLVCGVDDGQIVSWLLPWSFATSGGLDATHTGREEWREFRCSARFWLGGM